MQRTATRSPCRPLIGPDVMQPAPSDPSDALGLIEPTLAALRHEFRGSASTLDVRFWRSTEGERTTNVNRGA
jgi:hypothetical protein